jgi:hypothetical protein
MGGAHSQDVAKVVKLQTELDTIQAELGKLQSNQSVAEEEPPIYFYAGHGFNEVDILKDVPIHCKYVNMGVCGLVNRLDVNYMLYYFKKPSDKRFVVIDKPQIETLLDGLSIRTYLPFPTSDEERYVHSTFYPISVYPKKDKITFNIKMSGLIERKKSILINNIRRYDNITSISLDMLKLLFSMSVYPTPEEIDTHFRTNYADRLEALTLADLNSATTALRESTETLMKRFPGIHYNFLCRGGVELPSHPAILRRAISAMGGRTHENAIRQSYRENYPLLNLLETALEFEKHRIALNSTVLTNIIESGFKDEIPGEDSSIKTALLTHLTTGTASTWNPLLDQKTKNILLSTAVQKNYIHSIKFLIKLGAASEILTMPLMIAIHNRDTPRALSVLNIMDQCMADLNFRNVHGETPLIASSALGLGDVVVALLATEKVDVNAVDSVGSTPLMLVCFLGRIDLVAVLLATKKVDINAANKYGATALILACRTYGNRNDIALRLLEEPGINVNAKDMNGNTALAYCEDKMPAVRARLLALGATETEAEPAAAGASAARVRVNELEPGTKYIMLDVNYKTGLFTNAYTKEDIAEKCRNPVTYYGRDEGNEGLIIDKDGLFVRPMTNVFYSVDTRPEDIPVGIELPLLNEDEIHYMKSNMGAYYRGFRGNSSSLFYKYNVEAARGSGSGASSRSRKRSHRCRRSKNRKTLRRNHRV